MIGGKRVAALLWLWDPTWSVLALNAYQSNVTRDATPSGLLGLLTAPIDAVKYPLEASASRVSIAEQPALRLWAEKHNFARHERIWPVRSREESQTETIAFLQVLSSDPITGARVNDADVLCRSIAILISQSRSNRQLQAVNRLLEKPKKNQTWLEAATDALYEITNAMGVIVFRDTSEGFKGIVIRAEREPTSPLISSPKSIVNRVAEGRGTIRLPDFADSAFRKRVFGTTAHDQALHAIMQKEVLGDRVRSVVLAPVVFKEHTLAVIALVNKRPEVHLARVFSKTDEDVLNTVAGFLSGILPSIEMYEAVGRMANVVLRPTFGEPDQLHEIFALLTDMIPGTTGVGLIRRSHGDGKHHVDILGGSLWTDDVATLTKVVDAVQSVGSEEGEPRRYYITVPIQSLNPRVPSWLTVELNRAQITGYEQQFLSFFCKELSHVIISEQGRDEVVERFSQLRHGIRSGLTGVIGYVHEAQGCYELYKNGGFAPTDLSRSRFRKALDRANYAAAKTQKLLEESRFLLGQITPSALRVGANSVSEAVTAVLNALRPYADERGLTTGFNDQWRTTGEDVAFFDRMLIDILLFNILDNAIKYSHRKRQLLVTLDRHKDSWRVNVTNYGVYIRPDDKAEIFKPFMRTALGSGNDRPGTGLGLAVADEIAKAHYGSITCESKMVEDRCAMTTFVVTLPKSARPRS